MERSGNCKIYDINNNNNNKSPVLNIMRHVKNNESNESGGVESAKVNSASRQSTFSRGSSDNINVDVDVYNNNKPTRKIVKRQDSHEDDPDSDDVAYAADVDDDDVILRAGDNRLASTIPNKTINQQSSVATSPEEEMADDYETILMSPTSRRRRRRIGFLLRDNSLHSDSSLYSSVDSLLEARKPDPEAILINLGFGPVESDDILSRIPKRFLKPSQVRGIDTEAFVRRLQLASSLHDHSVLGYRGLTGNPDVPPSSIVAKIMERFEVNQRKKSMGSIEQSM